MDSLVSIARCSDYDEARVKDSVAACLESLGDPGTLLEKGARVLLKPNLLSASPPEKGITTHPSLVKAVACLLKERGCLVSIGDSHGGYERKTEELWDRTGMRRVASEVDSPLVNFEGSGADMKTIHGKEYPLSRAIFECDAVVNLPRLKTHMVTTLTGAVKNMFGCVPGFRKAVYHRDLRSVSDFSRMLVDVCELSKPALTIMDAVVSMDGNGPAAGRLRNTGFILASRSPYALDAAVAVIISARQGRIPTVGIAAKRVLGPEKLRSVEFTGDDPRELRVKDFALPRGGDLPPLLASVVGRALWVKPRVDPSKCVACGECAADCPVGAIEMLGDRASINLRRCLSCFCCQEMCPEAAVVPIRSRHLRMIHR